MADLKMSQFTPATDGAYIYAEAADGSQVKIAKADLVELIRAAMPIVSSGKPGLASLNTSLFFAGASNDCNSIRNGVYALNKSNGAANLPDGVGNINIIVSINAYTNGEYILQFCSELNGDGLFYRRKVNAIWTRWARVVLQ